MYEVGYTTGTFDLLHRGHYEILKKCKLYCKKLIVGLVSDELGIRQKRRPVLEFEHRKTILENSKYVDAVVKFDGSSKQEDYLKMHFEVLFISDEYYKKLEYTTFQDNFPHIPVIYFPVTGGVSTSQIFKNMVFRFLEDTSTRAASINGDILAVEWKNGKNIIVKPVKISSDEVGNTKNNYLLPVPPPRNWKMINCDKRMFPNVTGVNPNRELEIFEMISGKDWFPGFQVQKKETDNYEKREEVMCEMELDKKVELMNYKRKNGKETYWILQEDGGETLTRYLQKEDGTSVFMRVREIIREMRDLGIVHGDLHSGNILIKDGNVSIIDFGWCLHKSFEMEEDERQYYKEMLESNFDLIHFRESLVHDMLEDEIPACLMESEN